MRKPRHSPQKQGIFVTCKVFAQMLSVTAWSAFQTFFEHRSFDYIVLGKAVNTYADFPWLLRNLLRALRPAGVLFLKLRNTQDIISYLNMMGRNFTLEEFVMQVSAEQFNEILNLLHVQSCNILSIPHQVDAESQNVLLNSLKKSQMTDDVQAAFKRLMTKEYAYCITK